MQGIHCTSDAPYVLARLGPKRAEEGAYVWQKLRKSGAVLINGTDAPVEDVDPIRSYYASVTRQGENGNPPGGYQPDQKLTRLEALRSYTKDAYWASFAEAYGGVGFRAEHPDELDDKIREMIAVRKPVLFDCRVTKEENCFPMIPSGKAHNEMIMAEEARDLGSIIDDAGKRLV